MFNWFGNQISNMRKIIIIVFTCCISLYVNAQSQNYSVQTDQRVGYSVLKTGFVNPPPSAGVRCYWWWLNGKETAARKGISMEFTYKTTNLYVYTGSVPLTEAVI